MIELVIRSDAWIPAGKVALLKDGNPVWIGNLSDPWDDVETDTIIVSPSDYDRVKAAVK